MADAELQEKNSTHTDGLSVEITGDEVTLQEPPDVRHM